MKFSLDQASLSDNVSLSDYLAQVKEQLAVPGYFKPDDFIKLPTDADNLAAVENLARAKNLGGLKWVILVGIGGSSLGAEAVYQAMRLAGPRELKNQLADLTVVDTVDPIAVAGVIDRLTNTSFAADELLLVVVGKSGSTTETVANASVLYQVLVDKFGPETAPDRMVVISDQDSPLMALAESAGFATLTIPSPVGGRFSVFSPAGLLPLAACGISVKELLVGASLINESAFNQAGQSAEFLFEQNRQGKMIHDFFVFSKELEGVGKWYRQLLAESTGKDGKGLIPTVSVGSTDLHSQIQLVFDGPANRVTTLVSVEHPVSDPVVPEGFFAKSFPGLVGKTLGDIMAAIYQGVFTVYQEKQLPVMEIKLAELSAKEIGSLMQFLLIQVVCVCRLLEVDAYSQPAVGDYKTKVTKILST